MRFLSDGGNRTYTLTASPMISGPVQKQRNGPHWIMPARVAGPARLKVHHSDTAANRTALGHPGRVAGPLPYSTHIPSTTPMILTVTVLRSFIAGRTSSTMVDQNALYQARASFFQYITVWSVMPTGDSILNCALPRASSQPSARSRRATI